MTWKLHASYPQPAELLDKFFPTKSWFINGLSSSEAFEGKRTRRVWSHPAQCGVWQHRVLCAPFPKGCPSSTGIPGWKSPLLPAALTQQPAPPWPREAKWIQDPQGLMESQAQAGFAQRFLPFPSCLMCVGTFYSSASATHRFFHFLSFF